MPWPLPFLQNYLYRTGRQGRGVTGVAFKGWNLIDKFGRAQDGMTYHFHNQGYSNCKVYESQTPRR